METEYKFLIPSGQIDRIEQALLHGTSESVRVRSHYFDTADAVLRRHGMSLRIREEGTRRLQTLKWGGDGLVSRHEDEIDLGGLHEPWTPPDPTLHRTSSLGRPQARLLAALAEAPSDLQEVFVVDCERIRSVIPIDGGEVEVALDRGEVRTGQGAGARAAPIQELELELRSGAAEGLATLARRWAADHGLWLASRSKSQRGWALRDGAVETAETLVVAERSRGKPSLASLVRQCLAQVLPRAATIAEGSFGDEDIHKLRVGLRRLRTVLAELHAGSGRADPGWQEPLATTFRALGQWRDSTHVLATVLPEIAAAGGPQLVVEAVGDDAATAPDRVVRDRAFQAALIDLIAFARTEDSGRDMPSRAFEKLMRRRLRRLFRKIAKAAPTFAELPVDDQHRVRKRLKKVRYLVEFGEHFLGRKALARFIEQVKPVQDALGQLNDVSVARTALEAQAAQQPSAWFGAGWLAGRRPALVEEAQQQLEKIAAHGKLFA